MANSDSRWEVLAALRFVLASLVLITHSGIVDRNSNIYLHFGGQTGFAAVFVFFIVSGFSIAASLEKSPTGYFWRRVKRIYPTFLSAILFCALITGFGPLTLPYGQVVQSPPLLVWVGNIFMVQGVFTGLLPQDAPLYSLAIEWWLYMLAPLLLVLANTWALRIGWASFIFMFCFFSINDPASTDAGHLNILLYSWPWLFGFAYYRDKSPLNALLLVGPPLVLFSHFLKQDYAAFVVGMGAAIVLLVDKVEISSTRMKSIMLWLGDVSYPLYVFHSPLLFFLATKTFLKNGNVLVFVVLAIVSVGYFLSCVAWDRVSSLFARNPIAQRAPV